MSTIKDVAREAGVSLGTVSNVLNGKPNVKKENKEKVQKAIRKVGFQYNMAASFLRTKTSKNIGLIIPSITNPYYPELARGVSDSARIASLTVFLCNDDRDVSKEHRYVDELLSKGVDGIILVKPQMNLSELKELNRQTALVLVDVGEDIDSEFHVINVCDEQGIIQGMTLLRQYGHKKIAFVNGLLESYSSKCRVQTYRRCLADYGFDYRPEYVISGNYDWQSGYTAARQLMQLQDPPTAIFASNDLMALGVIKSALEKGIRIPEELSVLGFDDIDMSNLCTPSLTTIHQPKYEIGIESMNMLLACMNGEMPKNGMKTILETRLVFRDSVGYA